MTGLGSCMHHALLILLLLGLYAHVTTAQLEGSVAKCENEGEVVHVPRISDDPCITCTCRNREIACNRETCGSLEGCHMILYPKPADSCCNVCKGCSFNGTMYPSGKSWKSQSNPCDVYTCNAGVITTSRSQCYVTCRNPKPVPGQCCPACSGCTYKNMTIEDGETFTPDEDRCVSCKCEGGSTKCTKRACPVLNCPPSHVFTPEGACCPECRGQRTVIDLKGRACLFRNRVYPNGRRWLPAKCTKCSCESGNVLCNTEVCPPLACRPEEVIPPTNGSCCPVCPPVVHSSCKVRSKTYEHGQKWTLDMCTDCTCDDGVVKCSIQQCSNALECPKNHKLQIVPGECCPKCVEDEAVCAVFGDPHYRTFDGRIYNFQGTCSYILSQDCVGGTYSIRVKNDARLTNNFAWTKTVTLHINGTKVTLHQKLVTKVDRTAVTLPFIKPGTLAINRDGSSVAIRTSIGLKIVWDGDSYVEVTVPPKFKNKLCGLCGNFNNIEADDFMGKKGRLALDAEEFAKTWRAGSKRSCRTKKKSNKKQSQCTNVFDRKQRAHRDCAALRSGVFASCRRKVDVGPYFRSCITDMCDCPNKRQCACESLKAYARACARKGVSINWRSGKLCGGDNCPNGAVYSECGPACSKTCSNWNSSETCKKPCKAGCHCPEGTVLHKKKCIKPSRCPKRKRG